MCPTVMAYLPLFLKTDVDYPVLVIGGGEIAAAKTEALASVGAHVEIIARDLSEGIIELAAKHNYLCQQVDYDPARIQGKALVIAATDDDDVNARVATDCRARGVLVNVVDNPPLCDFIFPALVRRGPLQIAISTSGIAPVLARMIKQTLENTVPHQFERLMTFMADKKQVLRKALTHLQPRRLFSETVVRGAIAEDVLEGNMTRANERFDAALKAYPNENKAALYLIGAGPGNPDLLTLKAVRLLGRADVILYDRLVGPSVMEAYARKDAEKILVGKTRCKHHKKQSEIDVLIKEHLQKGHIVARLKGGDPAIYAHGAEEIAIAQSLNLPYHIVPGITAASGCAAYSGIPLTDRGGAHRVRFMTVYKDSLASDKFWQSLQHTGDETLVFYMSSHQYGALCEALISQSGHPPETPLLIVEQGTTPCQKEYTTTLAGFKQAYGEKEFLSPSLMIIGDVVKWQKGHTWKEPPEDDGGLYFTPLPNDQEGAKNG